jgi:hypothetical protein
VRNLAVEVAELWPLCGEIFTFEQAGEQVSPE